MSSSNDQMKFHYRGKVYALDLEPANNARIEALAKQRLVERYGQERVDKNQINPSAKTLANRIAAAAERAERATKAKNKFLKNNAYALSKGEAPNESVPNGVVASGDPGISQRHSEPDPAVYGAKNVTKQETGKQAKTEVITDSDRNDATPTLVDKLNDLVYSHPKTGYVTKALTQTGSDNYLKDVVDVAYQMSGRGHQNSQIAQIFRSIDRYDLSLAPKNVEQTGYTFITRPRLNLSDVNLAADRRFTGMRTNNVNDVAFGIRCMLDTQFCRDNLSQAQACPLIDLQNPFSVLLCNALTSISGFQDPTLTTETTDNGFFQEAQTYAIGGDRMARGYEFTLSFRDYPGSPVLAAIDYWYQYMMNLCDGSMIQYADAIDANRLDYTVSIYRFIVDRTRRVITKWAKATGCFPINSPSGVPFNKGQNEMFVTVNDNFSVNFKVNHVGFTSDPLIIQEFNMLVRRYLGKKASQMNYSVYTNEAQNNFTGIPYIGVGEFGYEMMFLHNDTSVELTKSSSSSTFRSLRYEASTSNPEKGITTR